MPAFCCFTITLITCYFTITLIISRSSSLSLFFSLRFAGLSPPFFSLYSEVVDMTINLSLIVKTTRTHKQFPLSVFVFIDSLVVSASQDAGGYAISHQNNLELQLVCHTCWLSYFTLVHLWCRRTVGWAYGHVITKISRIDKLPNFLTMVLRCARFAYVELR